MPRRKTALATLAFLSPFTAEFLLGDQYLVGPPTPRQIGMFALFVALYGAGAILIREIARRAGRGWPTILTLSLAYAVLEEGLLTQSLFNPDYANAHLLDEGFIPGLGIAGPWTVYVLTLHVVWSMATPIAITEALFGRDPWLRPLGITLWTVLLAIGAAATFTVSLFMGARHFLAHPAQLATSAAIALALIVVALRVFRFPIQGTPRINGWAGFALGLGVSSAFQVVMRNSEWFSSAWLATALMLGLESLTVFAVLRLRPPVFPLAAGAAITYCWLGFGPALKVGTGGAAEQSVLVAATLALLACTAVRTHSAQLRTPVQ
ncbi:hypothetical protein [Amycolatopsis sp. NPDC058986]|uniref:hypothetical protein n=1 Tax=unclassified Amycolatopsis TaxID=2618356 RepID=UPI00366F4FB6